jgi:hypothetical protein
VYVSHHWCPAPIGLQVSLNRKYSQCHQALWRSTSCNVALPVRSNALITTNNNNHVFKKNISGLEAR